MILLFQTIIIFILLSSPLYAKSEQHIAVLYPESTQRANQLYSTIIRSMREHSNAEIHTRKFSIDEDTADIEQWLIDKKSQAVILLGKQGLKFGSRLSTNIPIISGAHMAIQPNQSSVLLTADPQLLFKKLKKLQPNIKTVHVIYSEKNSKWLIAQARKAAHQYNMKLNAIQVTTIQTSGPALKNLIQSLNTRQDAIWLPYDPVLPIKHLLPDLLKKSWAKNIVIFSGNPYHVQQGTLFALFPDYAKLGPQLIDFALKNLKKNTAIYFEASQYLNSAINTRTASHLGIRLSSIQKNNYKMVFPNK